jgi:hypothetical protein
MCIICALTVPYSVISHLIEVGHERHLLILLCPESDLKDTEIVSKATTFGHEDSRICQTMSLTRLGQNLTP